MNEEGELKDSIMTWYEDPTVAKKYGEGQTGGLRYKMKRKRTKEEILGGPPKRRLFKPRISTPKWPRTEEAAANFLLNCDK